MTLKTRYKHLTNTFNSDDMVGYGIKYISQYVDNSFFRNDNWFYTIKYSYLYLDSNPSGKRELAQFDTNLEFESFKNFGEVINKKKYNNIYVIINESYPNFRNKKLKNNLFEKIK